MSVQDIIIRVIMATIISGVIGFDREFKNRPAGLRTHILVCTGATIIALVQVQLAQNAYQMALKNPEISNIFIYEQGHLVAQIISGIGFLGAGTIIVTKHFVSGLTTAASLWAVAGLGIAIGMGMYTIAISGFIIILIVLVLLKRLIKIPHLRRIEINYQHRETKDFIYQYFNEHNITIKDIDFKVLTEDNNKIYVTIYTIELPRKYAYIDIVEDISSNKNITKVSLIAV
ncbi:MgtC/SapB family protein [Erysipelotrichaceae bacterium OttesenSCG-928-M19]|nr:MgtC/SapB family protein [Erysipelotrichaceae bacterium OttesenSCG-928-M19]